MTEAIAYHTCKHYVFDLDEPAEWCACDAPEFPVECNAASCPHYDPREGAPDE